MRKKIQFAVMFAFSFILCMGCGVLIAAFMVEAEKQGHNALFALVFGMLVYAGVNTFHIFAHETGHMIFGMLTGYKFISIRFGNIIFVNTESGIKIRKYEVSGTGGQCLMMSPEKPLEEMPVFWYNMGGCIVNIVLCAVAALIFNFLTTDNLFINMFFVSFIIMGMNVGAVNALPLSELGADGANAIMLVRNINARKAFINSLIMTKTLSEGKSINELPESFFEFDRSIPLDNILVTSQAVTYFNKLFCDRRFDEALEAGEYIIENAKSISSLREGSLLANIVFIYMVHLKNFTYAGELYNKYKKKIKQTFSLINGQRFYYAYYKLYVRDDKKAGKSLRNFESIAKNYPYRYDLDIERGFIETVNNIAEKKPD